MLQIPLFVTAVMAVRRMSVSDWPGFETGTIQQLLLGCIFMLQATRTTSAL